MRWVEKDRKRNWRSGRRKSTEMRYFDENVLFFYESRNKCEERAGPKAGNEMGVFCKKWTFPQRRVHYVQYRYFLFYILLIWVGCVCTQRTPLPTGLYGRRLAVL